MANKEQLERLKQGVEGWNKWREENPGIEIDLEEADLIGGHLSAANLSEADFGGADLSGANLFCVVLSGAHLLGADLSGANLSEANLSEAILFGANLREATLREANLSEADLSGANLSEAILFGVDLREANLSEADLSGANLNEADLRGANLSEAIIGYTLLVNLDLSEAEGLDEVQHESPSHISTDTLRLSKGKIPEVFLRGCGLSDWEIESAKLYQPGLSSQEVNDVVYRIYDLRANQAIQINPLFLSYSHKDSAFVDEMEKHLDEKGIRFWRDIHDATAGRLEKVVDRAMRLSPTVLLILSEHSVKSDWVEHEARTARELEKELGRDVLCPVALDDTWKECKWPARLREQIVEYHILDFSEWKDEGEFGKMFRKLIDGLDLFYKQA